MPEIEAIIIVGISTTCRHNNNNSNSNSNSNNDHRLLAAAANLIWVEEGRDEVATIVKVEVDLRFEEEEEEAENATTVGLNDFPITRLRIE